MTGASLAQPAALFRFDPTHRLASAGSAAPTAGALTLTLPPRSATLAVLSLPAAAAGRAGSPARSVGPGCRALCRDHPQDEVRTTGDSRENLVA